MTALPPLLTFVAPGLVEPDRAPALAEAIGATHPLVWALLVLQLPGLIVARRALERGDRPAWSRAHAGHSLVQISWLLVLAWFTVPTLPTLGLALVTAILVCWAANDALGRLDPGQLHRRYFLGILLADLLLLGLDALGGPGPLAAAQLHPRFLGQVLAFQLVLGALVTGVITHVSRSLAAQDRWRLRQDASARKLAVMEAERAVIAQSSVLLGHGLAAGQFAHDVASPVTVMRAASEELDMLLDESPARDPHVRQAFARLDPTLRRRTQAAFDSWELSARQVLRDLEEATQPAPWPAP